MAENSSTIWNVPNQLTAARLVLSIAVFALLSLGLPIAALVVFIIAASTDWVDGYWARKYDQVTKLGRIFDPFVDKVLICGTFVLLAEGTVGYDDRIYGWMAVVVFAREMLVTALRGFIEQEGGDFSAKWSGKWKMLFQCIAAGAAMVMLSYAPVDVPQWLRWTVTISIWVAVISTVQSGLLYIFAASKLLSSD